MRAAAVEAIARRRDRSLLPSAEIRFSDRNAKVRYSAAAAAIRLSATGENQAAKHDP